MQKPVLVVLAAGMGSRYGGLKQMDPVGGHGQSIIDYSIYDARQAGFETVVFVIKKEMEADFRQAVGDRISKGMHVRYAFQALDDLPAGYAVPDGRKKPWGTTHAVLAARSVVDGPFAVINADDYYGPEAFRIIYNYLSTHADEPDCYQYAMIGYRVGNTVTENGSVARGICQVDGDGYLQDVVQRGRRRNLGASARCHAGVHELLGIPAQLFRGGRGPVPLLPGQDYGGESGKRGVFPAPAGGRPAGAWEGKGPGPLLRREVVRRHVPGGQAVGRRGPAAEDGSRTVSRESVGGLRERICRAAPRFRRCLRRGENVNFL